MNVYLNGSKFRTKCVKFSGGELHPNVSHLPREVNSIGLVAKIKSSDDLIETLLTCEALNAWCYKAVSKTVYIPYIPYARQDRRCAEGDSFSLAIVSSSIFKAISNMGFIIASADIHSNVGKSIIELNAKITNMDLAPIIYDYYKSDFENSLLVCPDKGAIKRTQDLATHANKEFIQCEKVRDPMTGQLSGFKVNAEDLKGQDVIIFDDICDGGGTFIGLAKELKAKNCGKISLCVTHGIFSKGVGIFSGIIDNIYTTDTFYSGLSENIGGVELKVLKFY